MQPERLNDAGRRLGPGIDVRGDGGYVLAPPSLHHSGRTYDAVDPKALAAELPTWMTMLLNPAPTERAAQPSLHLVRDGSAWARSALESEAQIVREAAVGSRNATLNRAAFNLGQIVAGGELDQHTVEAELMNAALAVGLTERESEATVASGLQAGLRLPRRPVPNELRPRALQRPSGITFVPWPKD